MLKFIACFSLLFFLAGCETPKVTKDEMDSVNYGPAPVYWKDEIKSYLKLRLKDPTEAIVEFPTEPKQMFQKQIGLDPQVHGWAVCVLVRDKKASGAWDDAFPMTVFLRNEKIVAVNGGPDDANIIGAKYAREQCERLGAPFKQ